MVSNASGRRSWFKSVAASIATAFVAVSLRPSKALASSCSDPCKGKFNGTCYGPGIYLGNAAECANGSFNSIENGTIPALTLIDYSTTGGGFSAGCMSYSSQFCSISSC